MEANEGNLFDTDLLIEASRRQLSLHGFTTILNLIEFPKALAFEELEALEPTGDEYKLALEFSTRLLQRGTPVPAIDLLVSAVSVKRGLELRSRDPHYKLVKAVAPALRVSGSL